MATESQATEKRCGQNRWEWSTVSGGPEGHVHRSRSWSQGRFRSRRGDPLGSLFLGWLTHRSDPVDEFNALIGTRGGGPRLPLHLLISKSVETGRLTPT